MKKVVLVVAVALSLGACTTAQNIGTGISLVTKSVTNPVTPTEEAQVEAALSAALAVLNGYKRACIAGTADKRCRVNIQAIQVYTRQMGPLVVQLRNFVDNNDQINAVVVYNQLTALYANFKAAAAGVGYNVGALP